MFAIASDDPAEVRRVLMEVDSVAVNNTVGPQSALAFALTSNQLVHKLEIVKTLLAYGADPGSLKSPESNPPSRRASLCPNADDVGTAPSCHAPDGFMSALDPATRYYVERAEAPETCRVSKLLHRTEFQPLARGLHAEIVGQTRALEQLAKILSIHFPRSVQHGKPSSMYSQKAPRNAMVVLLCGPSGHGKSLLARKFGSLLDVPTHTVNMTTLGSANDLWQSYSLSPYEEPSPYTLAEFLSEHEGERCVVVLDEIEKTLNENALWSLLMPWELGRCTFHAGSRNIDVRNVIWIGTSNIGHTLVYGDPDPDDTMPREDYVTLMNGMRPRVSERLGASVVSRVSAILPFVPFTRQEKQAIAAESLLTLVADHAGDPDVDTDRLLKKATMDKIIDAALADYEPAEGARSLYRNVTNLLVDML
ncbi:P-loop containing nucleoside triphosphate hydrolase protein [Fistulina hepatica ATCC 64428]|nr:P-loop containing nucleoside triphosphate hydrolase protein [Fistulina hepatica ATCC 64428]